jgi:hypothetical protein
MAQGVDDDRKVTDRESARMGKHASPSARLQQVEPRLERTLLRLNCLQARQEKAA